MGFRLSAWDDFFPTKESIMSVQTQSLIEYFATKAGIAPDKYLEALRGVPFVNCPNITREEMTVRMRQLRQGTLASDSGARVL